MSFIHLDFDEKEGFDDKALERLFYVLTTVFIIDVRYFQPSSALFNMSLTQFLLRLNGKQVSRAKHVDVFVFLSYFCSDGRTFPHSE